jgi:hypothetical protein
VSTRILVGPANGPVPSTELGTGVETGDASGEVFEVVCHVTRARDSVREVEWAIVV